MKRKMFKKIMSSFLTLAMVLSLMPVLSISAEAASAAYPFSNLGTKQSNYYSAGDYFKVGSQSGSVEVTACQGVTSGTETAFYPSDSIATSSSSDPYIIDIKANGGNCKTFTFVDMGLSAYSGTSSSYFSSFDITFYDALNNPIPDGSYSFEGGSLGTSDVSTSSVSKLSEIFPAHGVWSVSGVAWIEIKYVLICNGTPGTANLQFENITVDNISNTINTPPTVTIATQTVKGGADITVQSSKTGYVYLVDNTKPAVDVDTTAELDALVTAGTATKVTITAANTNTTLAAASAEGIYAAVGVDSDGSVSAKSTNLVTVDNTAPNAPSMPDLASSSDSGASSTDNITSDTTPTFTGTAEANSTVKLYLSDHTEVGTATANGSGNWSITSPVLTDGDYQMIAAATDAAGNKSSDSLPLSVTIDTTAPTFTIGGISLSADTGSSNSDFITKTASQTISATLSGALSGTDGVYGSLDNGTTWTNITSKVSGISISWDGVTLSGSDTLKLSMIDAAGNNGSASSQAYVLDTTAPTVTFSNLELSDDTGSSSTDFITSTASQTISAALSSALGGSDKIYGSLDNGTTWTDITAKVSGTTLTWNGVILTGSSTLKLKVVDAAGNDGTITSQAYVLATTAPTTTVSAIAFSADTGSSSTDYITKTASQTISGTLSSNLASGEIVEVSLDNGSTWVTATATVGQNTWSCAGQTLTASNTMKVRVTSLVGLSGAERSQAYVLDTTAPTLTFNGISLSADTGSSNSDFVTKTASQTISATLSGALSGTDEVYGSLNNGTTWTNITSKVSGTSISWNGVMFVGSNALKIKVVDAAGNDGVASSQAYVLDTTAPTITFSNLELSGDTGSSSTDFITSTASQTISATLSSALSGSDKVYGSLDNGTTWTDITAKVSGTTLTWNGVTLTGSSALKLKVVDSAGNDGTVTSQAYVLASTAPTTTISAIAFSMDTGSSNTDFITKTAPQTISGTLSSNLASGEIVEVSLDNGSTWVTATATVGQNTWSLTGQTLNASNTMKVRVTSLAGLSGTERLQAYVLDTTSPTITFSNLALSADTGSSNSDFVTRTASQTISATLSSSPGGSDKVYGSLDNGSTWTDITAKVSGTVITWNGVTLAGSNTLILKVADAAGNDGTTASQAYVLDTAAPSISFSVLALSTDTGSSSTDFITNTVAQTISAALSSAPSGSDKVYGSLDNGATWTDITAKVSGTTLTWNGVTLTGSSILKLKVTDVAGNDGTIASQAYVLATTAPTTTVSAIAFSADTGSSSTDYITKTASQTISGTLSSNLASGEIVEVSLNNGSTWSTATATVGQNTWSLAGQTLTASSTMKVRVTSLAGQSGTERSQTYVLDTTEPTAGNSGAITVSDLTSNSAKLTWTAATDSGTAPMYLQYKDVYSTSAISSVAVADALSGTWTSNIASATVTGLAASTDYQFCVLVRDEAGNITLYTAATGKTTAAATGGGGSGGGSSNTGSTSDSTVVEVNGEKQDAGTTNTQTTGGQTVTTIKVDDAKLDKILDSKGEKPTITLPTGSNSDVTVGELNGQTVKNMEQKEAILEIKTPAVTYTLPASQIKIDDVVAQIGSQVDLKDIKVSVKIAEPSADTVKIVENTADKNSYQIVVKPIEFEITCTSGNKTVAVSKFNGYVERTVAIPAGIDPSKITTGIVLNSDGTFSHVPTQIVVINGKYYAKINSLTNSTYSVIWNPVTFKDVANHWSKDTVNDMGSRMVVTGTGNGIYEPDRSITRAEFAAIAVRAMGLQKGTTESNFGDVTLTDWFNGYVDTATEYSLITGYDSKSYGPGNMITREQAMAILARAMKLTGLNASLTDSEKATILSMYSDGSSVSDYAKTSAAICIKTGVVTGSSATTLSPKEYVTRAEVAVMVQRLLQKSGLI